MVKHENLHRIEWPLGVITAVYPDEIGVIRTAEVEECGRLLIRSVTFLVPLELDCHQEDDVIRQLLCDDQRGDEDNIENIYSPVDSTSEAGGLGSPTTTADAREWSILHNASLLESISHRTPGSSQASCSTTGTTQRCNITTKGDTVSPSSPSLLLPPATAVELQHSTSDGSEAEAEEPSSKPRQPRRAALRQRKLLQDLIIDDLL